MIILKATTETIRITTAATAPLDYSISYADITTTTLAASSSEGKITTATTVTILSAPAATTQRQVKLITISNRDASASNTVTIKKDISATEYNLTTAVTLLAGETMQYIDGRGWMYYSSTGALKGSLKAGGSNMQIQFNNNGVLDGDPDFTWDAANHELMLNGVDTNILLKAVTNEPAAPGTGWMQLYSKLIVGKMQLKIKGPSGLDTPLQAALWQNSIAWWTPGLSTALGTFTGMTGITMGTPQNVVPTNTSAFTAMRRSHYPSTTTANQQFGIRSENAVGNGAYFLGNSSGMGGFLFVCRFGFGTWTAGSRLFIGFAGNNAADLVTVNPSTRLQTLGFAIDAGDTAITFLHNDGVGTGTKEPLAGQPALASGNGYDAYIWCAPNSTTVYYQLDNTVTGATIVSSSVTTDLPTVNTMMLAQCVMGNGANTAAGAATLAINRLYIENDR